MISHYPLSLSAPAPMAPVRLTAAKLSEIDHDSWRYVARPVSRWTVAAAVLVSASFHAALLLSLGHGHKKTVAPVEERFIALTLAMPNLKELEEPEQVANDEPAPPVDLSIPVPMQADVPQLPQPNDFVQALNFASLLEQPDFSSLKVSVIPDNFRSGAKISEHIGKIFDLKELDRVPEPVLQPAPHFPPSMRHEGVNGNVLVEFIVDTDGRVIEAVAVASGHPGFNEAAVAGVARWKFRAGMRGGRKVNTRMRVPIVFRLEDRID